MKKTRVMVVDDQSVARQLFELYLKSSERYELVHMVESAAFAETFMKSDAVDLVLMDILMNDDSNGLDAAAALKAAFPQVKIIAITSMAESSWLKRAREIGIVSGNHFRSDGSDNGRRIRLSRPSPHGASRTVL